MEFLSCCFCSPLFSIKYVIATFSNEEFFCSGHWNSRNFVCLLRLSYATEICGLSCRMAIIFWPSELWAVICSCYESNQQGATIQVNLLFLVSSTCFRRCFRPSSGVRDYLQYLVVFTQCRCRLVSWMSFNSSKTPAGSKLGEYYQML